MSVMIFTTNFSKLKDINLCAATAIAYTLNERAMREFSFYKLIAFNVS